MADELTVKLDRDEYEEILRIADFNVAVAHSTVSRALAEGGTAEDIVKAQAQFDASMSLLHRLQAAERG